jgi:hypothetical protein
VFLADAGRADLTAAARRRLLGQLLDQVVAEAHQLGVDATEALELLAERFAQSPGPRTPEPQARLEARGRPALSQAPTLEPTPEPPREPTSEPQTPEPRPGLRGRGRVAPTQAPASENTQEDEDVALL